LTAAARMSSGQMAGWIPFAGIILGLRITSNEEVRR